MAKTRKRTNRLQRKNPNTDFSLYGIFGHPLGHTLSPSMQEAGFEQVGQKAYYLVFDFDLSEFRKTMKNLSKSLLEGFNLTVPYKETVIPYLDRLTPEAKTIGAVNTVYRKGKSWVGTNTDVDGFLMSLKKEGKFNPKGKSVLVLGAGGAARAVVYGLAKSKVSSLVIANRRQIRADRLLREYRKKFPNVKFRTVSLKDAALKDELKKAQLVVNTTSVGLKAKDPTLIPDKWIEKAGGKKSKLFYDLIYKPKDTRFLKLAKKKGHKTLGGIGMLLYQGVRAFEEWTGRKAPVSKMQKVLLSTLEGN